MKTYKRIFILLIGAVLFGLSNVNAYELKIETDTKNWDVSTSGIVKIPVYISKADGENIGSIPNVSCDTEYTKDILECSINGGLFVAPSSIVVPDGIDNNKEVTKLVVTNKTQMAKDTTITLKYNGKTDSTKKTTVTPKIEEQKKSSNNKLKAVYITNAKPTITPAFNQDVTEYTIYNVSDTLRSIAFDWDCAEGACSVDIEGPITVDGTKVELNVGENIVKLKVSAEDGSGPKIYQFKVIKGESDFNSSKLKSIVIGDYELSPKFDKDTKEYTAQVPYSLVTLATTLSYEPLDPNATVEVKGHDNLVVGENEITIKVTSADKNDETTYKIVVTRLDDQNIIIKTYKDGKIGFIDSSNEKKELTEEEFEKQYPDEYKKIKDGTYKFDEDGNIIKDSNANSEEVKEKKKGSKTWIIVILIVVGIAIIGISGYFIFKKPSDKNKKKKGDKDDKKDKSEDDKEEKEEKSEEEKSEEDLLNLSDEEIEETKVKSNPAAELDYDVESEIESVERTASRRNLDDTIDIDEALSDLMSTRQYNFTEEDENK